MTRPLNDPAMAPETFGFLMGRKPDPPRCTADDHIEVRQARAALADYEAGNWQSDAGFCGRFIGITYGLLDLVVELHARLEGGAA